MACVAIPQQFARIGKFKGDGEGLVDCLIKACEQRPASSAVSASFGRELVPWTDDTTLGMALEPLECSGRGSGSMFPATSKTDPKGGPAHKAPTSKRAKASGSPRSSSTRVAQPAGGKRTSTNGFACPALASAPKPCDLPMPTFGLMSRAILRSRSPSPGKDAAASSFFHPGQMQQLVRPVAA